MPNDRGRPPVEDGRGCYSDRLVAS